MDERFEELARLLGEQLARRWVGRSSQRDQPRGQAVGTEMEEGDRRSADAAAQGPISVDAQT